MQHPVHSPINNHYLLTEVDLLSCSGAVLRWDRGGGNCPSPNLSLAPQMLVTAAVKSAFLEVRVVHLAIF